MAGVWQQYSKFPRVSSNNLPFFYSQAEHTKPPQIIQDAKNQILKDFISGFKESNKSNLQLQSMHTKDIETILNQWKSSSNVEGTFGKELSDELFYALEDKIFTGAFLESAMRESLNNMANAGQYSPNAGAARFTQEAQAALDILQERFQNYITILSAMGEDVLLAKFLNLYILAGGVITDPEINNKYQNLKITPSQQNQINKTVLTNLNKLEEIVNALNETKQSGTYIPKSLGGFGTPKQIMKAGVAGAYLNKIGGEGLHESLTAFLTQIVGKYHGETLEEIQRLFKSNKMWTVIAEDTGGANLGALQTKISGKQKKVDVSVTWTDGTYNIEFGVSNKLTQGWRNIDLKTGQLIGNKNLQSISLGELLNMAIQSGTALAYEQGWAAIINGPYGAYSYQMSIEEDTARYNGLINSWNQFKAAAKYIGFFRALVGTGLEGDFASIFIVNSRVFSGYDILKNIDTFSSNNIMLGKNLDIPNYEEIGEDVASLYTKNNWPKSASVRIPAQQDIINNWYKKKYDISINLQALVSVL